MIRMPPMFGTATLLNGRSTSGGSVDGGGDCPDDCNRQPLTIWAVRAHHLFLIICVFFGPDDVSQHASRSVVRLFRWDWRPPQKESRPRLSLGPQIFF